MNVNTVRQTTLDVIYENWRQYNAKLRTAIAPLTDEQLKLQPAARMWPLGQIVQHIISVRAGWFSGTLQDNDDVMDAYMMWGQQDSPPRSAAELARGLDETWAFIESRLQRWTPAECALTFPDEWEGQTYEVSRSWVIYHVLEHDLHHGGEVSLLLGMNGLPAPDI
ncbi:MAG TPA: DinB family protein [Chloroflexota bacterium]|nr:DinB family protein [Chloroflexota bacterium]HUM69041.1 DinB family protein [Chloroflexota bacterium]